MRRYVATTAKPSGNSPLTTGQIAKYCGVNFRTVIRWIERGHLRAYKLPGRGDNRGQVEDFLEFLNANEMPIPPELRREKRVLVVDDDKAMTSAIARVLRRGGYTVDVALDGFTAGAKLVDEPPALMTLDLNMPQLSGIEVLKQVRERFGAAVKILVVSGASSKEMAAARRAGCDEAIAKPFDNAELLSTVRQLIGEG